MRTLTLALAVVLAGSLTGCQTLATQRQDHKIAQYAEESGFPSPSDVGYVDGMHDEVAQRDDAPSRR